jgi:uncharacterized protein YukE
MPAMSWSDFQVHLREMQAAIGVVRERSSDVEAAMGTIRTVFAEIGNQWQTPSALTLEEIQDWFTRASADLYALLEEVVRRLQVAYDNYHRTELANRQNLT